MRIVLWVGAVTAGVAAGAAAEIPVARAAFVAVPPIVLAFALVRGGHLVLAQTIVAGVIGVYVGARASAPPPALPPALAAAVDRDVPVTLDGWVLSAPDANGPGARLRVAVRRVGNDPAHANAGIGANVALSVTAGVPDVWPGDAVRFIARLHSVRGLANPGVADSTRDARASGIDAFATVGAAAAIQRIDPRGLGGRPGVGATALRWAARARQAMGRAIDRIADARIADARIADARIADARIADARGAGARFRVAPAGDARADDAAGALLHTAVLGERRATEPAVEDGFRAAGATHVLSVSGLHLAAVALVFFAGVRRLLAAVPRLPLWIEPRRLAAFVTLPAIAFYTLVTGNAVATVRSALMMAMGLLGILFGRRSAPLAAIAAAVLALIAWSPLVVFDVSFQLSVVSVVALALFASRLGPARAAASQAWSPRALAARAVTWLGRLGAASVAAGVATAPLCAHTFGEVTPASPLGNLLLVPLVEMVVVLFGLAGAALGAIAGDAWGGPPLRVALAGARVALAVAERFRIAAPVWLTRAPNVSETAALSAAAGFALAALARGASSRLKKTVAAVALVGAAAGSLIARDLARRWNPDVIVTFLDVGQGDAAVIQAPGGHTILIDGGGTYDGSFDPGARVIEPFLRARGITRLDLVALSHPHPDHLGGLHRVLARFPVGALWTSGDDGHNPEYGRLLDEARAHAVALPVPARFEAGGVIVEPLGPFVMGAGGERIGPPEGTSVNDASLVLRARFGGRAALFAGDIEADGEGELAGRTAVGQTVASDLLKVPHHGSRTSSSPELIAAVRPSIAVMSLGWRNRFHFPAPEVVDRYRARGARVLRTDLDGAVTVEITAGGALRATCARGCR